MASKPISEVRIGEQVRNGGKLCEVKDFEILHGVLGKYVAVTLEILATGKTEYYEVEMDVPIDLP